MLEDQQSPAGGLQPAPAPATGPEPAPASLAAATPQPQNPAPADGGGLQGPDADHTPEAPLSWQASEYVHHHKSLLWYGAVCGAVIVLSALAALLKLWLEIGVFIAAGVAVIVYASKPPRTLAYELGHEGVQIDDKHYAYADFRSFGVVEDEAWHSIDLEPSKRFAPRLVMLFDDDDLDAIVAHLQAHLPREDRQPDLIERFTRKIRF